MAREGKEWQGTDGKGMAWFFLRKKMNLKKLFIKLKNKFAKRTKKEVEYGTTQKDWRDDPARIYFTGNRPM
jgi:hypothetical protein